MKRKELLQKDDDDGDSMLSSATSDTSSTKRKRFVTSLLLRPLASVCCRLWLEVRLPVTRRTRRRTGWKSSCLPWPRPGRPALAGDCATCSCSSPPRRTTPTTTRSSWSPWTSGPSNTTYAQTGTWPKTKWSMTWSWCSATLATTTRKAPRWDRIW